VFSQSKLSSVCQRFLHSQVAQEIVTLREREGEREREREKEKTFYVSIQNKAVFPDKEY